jgi:hypothetical protein
MMPSGLPRLMAAPHISEALPIASSVQGLVSHSATQGIVQATLSFLIVL